MLDSVSAYFLPSGDWQKDCDFAASLIFQTRLLVLFLLIIFLNVLALVLLFKVTKTIIVKQLFHVHLLFLIVNVSVAFAIRTTVTTIRSVIKLVYYFKLVFDPDDCSSIWSEKSCNFLESVSSFPVEALPYFYGAICLERLLAIFKAKNYEFARNLRVVIFLTTLAWLKPAVDFIFKLQSKVDSENGILYCTSLTSYAQNYRQGFPVWEQIHLFFIGLCVILAPVSLVISSKKRKQFTIRSHDSLSCRYQWLENLRTSRIVLANVLVYCLLNVATYAPIFALIYTKMYDAQFFVFAKELASFCFVILVICYSLFFMLTIPAIRPTLFNKSPQRVQPRAESDDYFALYQRQWS